MEPTQLGEAAMTTETEMVPIGPLTGAVLRRQATKKREERRRLRDIITSFNLLFGGPIECNSGN